MCVLSHCFLKTLCYPNASFGLDPTRRRWHASRCSMRNAASQVQMAEPRAVISTVSVFHVFYRAFAARENIASSDDIVLERPTHVEHSEVVSLSLQRFSRSVSKQKTDILRHSPHSLRTRQILERNGMDDSNEDAAACHPLPMVIHHFGALCTVEHAEKKEGDDIRSRLASTAINCAIT